MPSERGSRARRLLAALCAAGFGIALATLVTSQLSLMSILDTERAQSAAGQIADSRFTTELIEQTVVRAVVPVAGDAAAARLATVTSGDPRLRDVIRSTLIGAHRQVVDPDSVPVGTDGDTGNATVQSAISRALTDAGAATGIDLSGFDVAGAIGQVPPPSVVPIDLPEIGLRTIAEGTRLLAGLSAIVFAQLALLIHPRTGRAMQGLAWRAGVVCGVWLVGLLIAGWVIGLVATTLFGEMLQDVWSDAVPSMMLLVGAGMVLSVGIWFAGVAVKGLGDERAQRRNGGGHVVDEAAGIYDPYADSSYR